MNDTAMLLFRMTAVLVIYFLPALVAQHRGREGWGILALVNLLVGWTVIGWFVLLVVGFTGEGKKARADRELMMEMLAERSPQ